MSARLSIDGPRLRLVLCAYGLFALLGPSLPFDTCPHRALTGRPCPACGLTRAVAAALRGRLRRSVGLHPLGPLAAAAVTVAAAVTIAPRPRPSG